MADIGKILRGALADNEKCDVLIRLKSGEIFKCHGLVISLCSSFFKSKLSSSWLSNEKTIDCSNFEDDFVINAIEFCYGTEIELSQNNIETYLALSVYFGMNDLVANCEHYLKDNLSPRNVFKILLLAQNNGCKSLFDFGLDFLDSNFEEAVSTNDDFAMLPLSVVKQIIARSSLSIHEEFLFDYLVTYIQTSTDINTEEAMFSEISNLLSFTSMSLEFFVTECVSRNFLAPDRQNAILLYLSSESYSVNNVLNISNSRSVKMPNDIYVLRSIEISADASWQPDAINGDRIDFSSDSTVQLKAVDIYGSPSSSFLYKMSIFDNNRSVIVAEASGRVEFAENVKIQSIRLKSMLTLAPDTWYTAILFMKKHATFCSQLCLDSSQFFCRNNRPVTIFFKKSACGSSSASNGQFHGLILCGE